MPSVNNSEERNKDAISLGGARWAKLTFLGTGTSCGVPVVGCTCDVCKSDDPRDKRLRTSALLETVNARVLIDCGPDFRQQMLTVPFRKIDGVLLTHIHYDHVGGLDDLRPFCTFGDIDVYANQQTSDALHQTMPYVFAEHLYPGVPKIKLHVAKPYQEFSVGDIPVLPFSVMHKEMPIFAYRFGNMAYITDMKTIVPEDEEKLKGVETLIVNALRFTEDHPAHLLVDEAIDFARRIGALRTYFIHTTHDIGKHDEANSHLPEGFEFAYDGMTIDVCL